MVAILITKNYLNFAALILRAAFTCDDLIHGTNMGPCEIKCKSKLFGVRFQSDPLPFVAHRLDHAGNKVALNQTYRGGIDVIGAGRDMLEGLNCDNLVFGMPWWDHYLPLMLMARDANFVCGHGIKPWHLDHEGRWNKVQHVEFGKEFLRLLQKAAPLLRQNADFTSHMSRLENAFRGAESDTMSRRMKIKLLAATFPSSKAYYRRVLREASRLNENIFSNITAGNDK